jgi:hypothetical protein
MKSKNKKIIDRKTKIMMEQSYNKWEKWLKIIEKEVTDLHRYQHIFDEVQKIIKNNPSIQKPSSFYEFLPKSYVALVVMGIRRQIKIDNQSISLGRLLTEIIERPEIITRKRFIAMYTNSVAKRHADSDFDQFAGKGGSHVDSNIIEKDLIRLRTNGIKFEDYADRKLAHHDKRLPKAIPTYGETAEYIGELGDLLKRYVLLFRADCLTTVMPVYQYDWKAIFKEPWIQSE